MPVSARELFLIVRARDEASNTLRRVGQNIDRLQSVASVQAARSTLAAQAAANAAAQIATAQKATENVAAIQNAALERQTALESELAALTDARVGIENKLAVALERQNVIREQGLAGQDALAASEARMVALTEEQAGLQQRLAAFQERATMARGNAAALGLPGATVDASSIGKIQAQMERVRVEMAATSAEIAKQITDLDGLQVQYNAVSGVVAKYTAELEANTGAIDANKAAQLESASATKAAIQNELQVRSAQIRALQTNAAAMAEQDKALAAQERNLKFENFNKTAHAVGNLGRTFQYLGAISVGALGFAANGAAKLSTSVTLAATQVQNNVHKVAQESSTDFNFILKLMRQFPASAEDMSASLYDIFSTLKVNGAQGRAVLVQVNKAAVAGQISVQQATQGVLSVLNNFKLSWKDTGAVLNRTFAAVRFGRATLDEFQTGLASMAPAAKSAQQSFNTLAGTFAFLSRSLGPAKASIGFARLVEVINSPQMTKGLKGFGVSLQDANGHIKPLSQQIDILVKRFPYLEKGGTKALNFFKNIGGLQGTIQARRAFSTLVSNVQGYRDILGKTVHDNNEFNKSYRALAQSAGVQWNIFLNTLKSVFLTIGKDVLPTFIKMVQPLKEVANWFDNLSKSTQATYSRWIVLAAVGATIVGTLLSLGAALALTINGFAKLTGAGTPLAGLAEFLPLAAGLAILGVTIYNNWSTLEPLFKTLAGAVQTFFDAVKSVFDLIPAPIKEFGMDLLAAYTAIILLTKAWKAFQAISIVTSLTKTASAIAATGSAAEAASVAVAAMGGWPVIIGAVALAVGLFALKWSQGTSRVQEDVKTLNKALSDGTKAASDYATAHSDLPTVDQAIRDTTGQMKGLNTQSFQYQSLLQTLHGLEQQRATDLHNSAKALAENAAAQEQANSSLGDMAQHGDFVKSFNGMGLADAQAEITRLNTLAHTTGSKGAANMAAALQEQVDAFKKQEDALRNSVLDYRNWVANGINPASEGMKKFAHNIRTSLDQLLFTDPKKAVDLMKDFTPIVLAFTRMLKTPPSRDQRDYLNSIPKSLKAGMTEYTRLTGTILKRPLANILFNHKAQSTAIAAFLATTKDKFGSTKYKVDLKNLFKVPAGAIPDLTKYIEKHGHLPKNLKVFIHVALKDENKAKAQAKKVATDIAQQSQKVLNLQRLAAGRLGAGRGASGKLVDTGALDAAKKKLDALKNKQIKINAKVNPADPYKPFENTAKSHSAIQALETHLQDLAAKGPGYGQQLGSGIAQGIHSQIQHISGSVDIVIHQMKVAAKISSPSKRTADEVGKPMMQGVIMGMVKEAEGGKTKADIASAVKTITDALKSEWDSDMSQAQSNFGDLFSGTNKFGSNNIQDKIDWGEKLNIKDLQANLRTQNNAFRTFNRDIQRLQGRGAPLALIQQLRAMGPAANAELEALRHASKRQLRAYFRQYNESQRAIQRSARNQFDTQRAIWSKHGRSMAIGLLLGLRSETPALERYFKHLAQIMIGALRRHNKSHSPSRLYFEEGQNMMMGLQMGMDSVALKMNRKALMAGGHGHGGDIYNFNITANKDETYDATMKRVAFRLKHK